ncbi:hypothetical protein M0L20_07935 [Spirosoma sp. RP8]|uniref:Lipoprotein n=1 Tax=Spirosoma liriopis TaxID=2937440 RepID=A0ABT0HHY9_9BACT|nr:hypothetical protein [Spirosoma liriopis]MCK8491779.1 hypothetical protein [Spirosoma liriopis]
MRKHILISSVVLILTGLFGCENSKVEVNVTPNGARAAASNIVTEIRIIPYPYTYGWIWNKSTTDSVSVTCYYNMTLSSGSGWVQETIKVLPARQDFTYCRMGVKQIKLVITYDKSLGTYEFLSGKTYSCR